MDKLASVFTKWEKLGKISIKIERKGWSGRPRNRQIVGFKTMTILYFKLYAAELGLESAVKRVFVYGWVRGESTNK